MTALSGADAELHGSVPACGPIRSPPDSPRKAGPTTKDFGRNVSAFEIDVVPPAGGPGICRSRTLTTPESHVSASATHHIYRANH